MQAPYKVVPTKGGLNFTTDVGVNYRIRFTEEPQLGGCDTYQFIFSRLNGSSIGYDPKVKETILSVIAEFFLANKNVLLYICDTSDRREAVRNRLFIHWFEEFANPERFMLRTAHAYVEDEGFFAAIIVEKDNPKLESITNDFDRSASELSK